MVKVVKNQSLYFLNIVKSVKEYQCLKNILKQEEKEVFFCRVYFIVLGLYLILETLISHPPIRQNCIGVQRI